MSPKSVDGRSSKNFCRANSSTAKSIKSITEPILTKKYTVIRLKNHAKDLTNIKKRSHSRFRATELHSTIKEFIQRAKTRPHSVSNKNLSEVKKRYLSASPKRKDQFSPNSTYKKTPNKKTDAILSGKNRLKLGKVIVKLDLTRSTKKIADHYKSVASPTCFSQTGSFSTVKRTLAFGEQSSKKPLKSPL